MKLDGKVAVMTGAGNGIGAAMARRFAAEGAKVVVTDVEAEPLEAVMADTGGVGLAADITVEDNVKAVAELALATYGRIDVWHSNAGFGGPRQPADLQADELWGLMWKLHVMSHVFAARAVLPDMIERGDGYLLSTASQVAFATQIEKVAYVSTKSAALALAEWLAVSFRPKGIKVSCLCPGPMLTRMFLSNGFPDDFPAVQMALRPEEVAELVVRGIESERFLMLTHEGTQATMATKSDDYDAWLQSVEVHLGGEALWPPR